MATILARINSSSSSAWDNPDTWIGGIVPGANDVVMANGKVIQIAASAVFQELRNDTFGGAVAGGSFEILPGVTINANCYAGSTTSSCVSLNQSGPNPAVINGNVYAGSVSAANGARNSSQSSTLIVNGNAYGGTNSNARGLIHQSVTGFTILNGDAIGGTQGPGAYLTSDFSQKLYINGTAISNGYGPGSSGLGINGVGVLSVNGLAYVKATKQGSRGLNAVQGPFRYMDAAHASALVRATSGLTEIMIRAIDSVVPYPGDVRSGVIYADRVGVATEIKRKIYMGHF